MKGLGVAASFLAVSLLISCGGAGSQAPTPAGPTDPGVGTPAPVGPGPAPAPELPGLAGLEPELQPETRVLSSAELSGLGGLSVTNAEACAPLKEERAKCQFTFTLEPLPAGVTVGSVLVADAGETTPNGLLVKVTGIGGSTVSATEAALGDALKQGEFRGTFALSPDEVRSQTLARGVSLRDPALAAQGADFTFKLDHVELAEGVYADGQVSFAAGCGVGGGLTYDWFIIPDGVWFEASCGVSESAALEVTAQKSASLSKDVQIAAFELNPVTFMLGPVPVVVVPNVTVGVSAAGTVSAGMSFGAQQHFTARAGVKYDDGFKNITEFSKGFGAHSSSLKTAVEARAAVDLRQALLVYGLVGPAIDESGYLNFRGAPGQKPAWCLNGGVSGSVSLDLDLKVKRLRWGPATLFDESAEIGCAANTPPTLTFSGPEDGTVVYAGQLPVQGISLDGYPVFGGFKAAAYDLEDGELSVTWSSDREGELGSTQRGLPLERGLTALGAHTVTASVRDAEGTEAAASVAVNVAPPLPVVTLSARDADGLELSGTPITADYGAFLYLTPKVAYPPGLPTCCELVWDGGGLPLTEDGGGTRLELTQAGTFTVRATAQDPGGNTGAAEITVSVGPAPVVIQPQFSPLRAVVGSDSEPVSGGVNVGGGDVLRLSVDYLNYAQAQAAVLYV